MYEGVGVMQLAGVTAAVGMGVVFVALFLLSVYMHCFKLLTGRIEGRVRAPAAPRTTKPVVPPAASTAEVAAPGAVAAAVAVALLTVRDDPGAERAGAPLGASTWRLSGRMQAMQGRMPGHGRLFAGS